MNATEICEPTSITDQQKLWAAFVASYASTHQYSVLNAQPSQIFISPKLTFGVWVPQQSRDVWAKVLRRTAIVNSRSIITEDIFHDCGSVGATSE